ncbi:hypothetical protein GCM10010156_74020 [Planobispora rosea]|uniref:Uncharacterized protein n=1 Tax=Planobispora rosea TaxID=35762 RepID=A0A8J3S8V7_PLARO|nr:hypothetical protein [Planobispora rosea]GGT05510.1 hypothetical protein GCM10010156_74020 [Planobispora rosea]GIH88949.1 hypothetical protein Pro02_73570 [Planobispora rosea]
MRMIVAVRLRIGADEVAGHAEPHELLKGVLRDVLVPLRLQMGGHVYGARKTDIQ